MVRVVTKMPRPSWFGGKMKRIKAVLTLMMRVAPMAWPTRAATSSGRESARPQAIEASVNTTSPIR
jgi:hypothetical protein